MTAAPNEAAAVLSQITDDAVIRHNDFFQWLSKPVELRQPKSQQAPLADAGVDVQAAMPSLNATSLHKEACSTRDRVLKLLKERLEARCLTGFEMFRLMSTMPRAYKDRRAEIHSMTNPHRDSVVTPVQLRRCLDEILGLKLKRDELLAVVAFFFPSLPQEQYDALADLSTVYGIELKEFQARFNEMCAVGHITAEPGPV